MPQPSVWFGPLRLLPGETRELLNRARGKPMGPLPSDEREHFFVCAECGQAVDMRSLYQVFHHEEEDHNPLSESDLSESSPTT